MMSDIITKILLGVLASNALFTFIQFLVQRHDANKITPEKRAIRNILARDLNIDLKDWMHSDERSADDWELIYNNFSSYEELGGNGKIKKLYEEAASVPTTE